MFRQALGRAIPFCLAIQLMAGLAEGACDNPVARLFDFRNSVQLREAAAATEVPAVPNMAICAGDTVVVGERSRARLVFLTSGETFVIDENSQFVVQRSDTTSAVIRILRGALLFFTRGLRQLDVETPFVNASVEGTEFAVRVEGDRTVVTVLEGSVRASNPQGALVVGAGQQAVAIQGQAPQLQVIVRPRDAVQWALYYEPVLPADSLAALDQISQADRDGRFYLRRAGALLGVGRLDEARSDIDQALKLAPDDGDAYALRAVIAVALNDRTDALDNGRRAVERSPQSSTARIALSYALQSDFQLEEARDQLLQAVAAQPNDARAWARLAELWLSLGYLGRAEEAAERAASLAPDLGRASAILGFAGLARVDIAGASAAFERAIALESDSPLARLGLGLAKIRAGDLEEGRRDIEIAAALNPDDPIVRSYLGKAYFDEKRDPLAGRELDLAKTLDPLDPTPLFYDAIRKQTLNRPVEALRDLEKSIELNDNRAVYRSRFLLDADLAVRGARLGRIYRDLGFEQLALLEGSKSLSLNSDNHSAHRLLADSYLVLPRHVIARDSELLQAQLLQPININPVQPRLADNGLAFLDDTVSGIGFNEFTRFFAGNQLRFVGDGVIGEQGTLSDNLILSGIFNRLSFSVGQFHTSSDGVRENNDLTQNILNAFLQADLTATTGAQVEVRTTASEEGDRTLLFDPANYFTRLRSDGDDISLRLGVRQNFRPGAVLIGSYVHRTLDDNFNTGEGFRVLTEEVADSLEVRHLQEWRPVSVNAGFGYYQGDVIETVSFGPDEFPEAESDVHHGNAYLYAAAKPTATFTVFGGLSWDEFDNGIVKRRQANPKLGFAWDVTAATTLRGAHFRVLQRTLISSQTIEPTQVAGFNQFFEDGNGTDSWRSGVAIDHRFVGGLYAGAEISMRELKIPVSIMGSEAIGIAENHERFARAYLYATPSTFLALGVDYQVERLVHSPEWRIQGLAESTAHRMAAEIRTFLRSGMFVRLRPTFVYQEGEFQDSLGTMSQADTKFGTLNASVGYRLPNRWGVAAIDVQNAFDTSFRFQDSAPRESRFLPKRLLTARLTITI